MSTGKGPAFRHPEGVLTRQVQGELVLLDLNTEHYYGLDPIGADMVGLVTQRSLESALVALEEAYSVERSVLERDLRALVEDLVRVGLLEPVGDA